MNITFNPATLPRTERFAHLTGIAMTGLFALFMVFDTAIKIAKMKIVSDLFGPVGYDPELGLPIGVAEAIVLTFDLNPRTVVLATVLMTGLFAGAVSTHLWVGSPLFSHMVSGVYLGVLAWGGLWLRDRK